MADCQHKISRVIMIKLGRILVIFMAMGDVSAMDIIAEHENSLQESDELSLHDVVESTWQRNPELRVLKARLQHMEAELDMTRSLWESDPALTINHYNDGLMDSNGLMEWEVGVEFPLWLPGQRKASRNYVSHMRTLIDVSGSVLKLQLAGLVREILWRIALNRNQLSIAEKEWDVLRKLEKEVERRVALGDLASSNLILAQQESLAKRVAMQRARQEFIHEQHRYEMVTGLETLPSQIEETLAGQAFITTEHPALRQAHEKVLSGKLNRDRVKIEKRGNPALFVGTRHERAASGIGFQNALGIYFKMPLGLSTHTRPALTAAELSLSESRSELELLRRELNMVLHEARRDLEATREQYGYARKQSELAGKNLEFARKSFSLGESSLFELIRIQGYAFSFERNLRQKKLELGLQIARLNQARGIIP